MSDSEGSRVIDGESDGSAAEPGDDEERLVEAARTDRSAFGVLYDRHVDEIYHYVHRRVGDAQLAEDLTAAVWERALGAVERFELRGLPFNAWLYRIAGNIVANHYRRQRLRRYVPFVGQGAGGDVQPAADDRADVRQALRQLSEADQEIIGLHYYAGMSPAEIGQVLGCTPAVVHKRLQRARERLRRRIEEESRVDSAED